MVFPRMYEQTFARSTIDNLTVLSYFFWNDDRINTEFWRIECAFLCTFKVLGRLPAVLVVNQKTPLIDGFCQRHGIEIQVEPSLDNGLQSMSYDCITRLHERFETDNVLVVQNDGFPVKAGVEKFLNRYDYVGAPWSGHMRYIDLFPYPKYGVGNGGFSLRSKRICRAAANVFVARRLRRFPWNWFFTEDVFYCKTMRLLSGDLCRSLKFPARADALGFSVECEVPGLPLPTEPPVGFHSQIGFSRYCARYGVPNMELMV
ncbi:MAG: DUF5672 family protein [Prevotellaceae bacterium]|nr:DUF5672 family protein [Prevotellaceae bacterium]